MKNKVGLWIDHRQAVIVTITDKNEEIKKVDSGIKKHVRFSAGASADNAGEDTRDRQFGNYLTSYYEKIAALLRGAESIHIMGPGEAKTELQVVLEKAGLKNRVASVEAADKMTKPQVVARVKEYFQHEL